MESLASQKHVHRLSARMHAQSGRSDNRGVGGGGRKVLNMMYVHADWLL